MKRFQATNETRHALPLRFDRRDMDTGKRTITASLSSDTPVDRFFGVEILEHSRSAIDFSRARDGLPLLAYHDTKQPIGRAENVRLEGKKLRADLRFSAEEDASKIWRLVEDGTLRDTSLGYKIQEFEDDRGEGVRITKWQPIEASIVTTPADPNVGINRSVEERRMMDIETQDPAPANNVVDFTRGEKAERKRVTEIQRLFNRPIFRDRRYKDLEQRCISEGVAIEQARELLLEEMGRGIEPSNDIIPQAPGSHFAASQTYSPYYGDVSYSRHMPSELGQAITDTICLRSNVKLKDPHSAVQDIRHLPVSELARTWLEASGVRASGLSKDEIFQRAFTPAGTGDFSALFRDALIKSIRAGVESSTASWRAWIPTIEVPDFRTIYRSSLGGLSDLPQYYENGEVKYLTTSDEENSYSVLTYAGQFQLSRKALINDDLRAFDTWPRAFVNVANRKISDLVYAVLTDNAAMGSDSTQLFHADHSNLNSSGPLSAATLGAAIATLRKQTALGGGYLNPNPAFLIVPAALEVTARTLVSAQDISHTTPTVTANTQSLQAEEGGNPFRNLTVVVEPRLDANSATAFYVASNDVGHVEVAFLAGSTDGITFDQEDSWSPLGVAWKVILDVGAAAVDYRGIVKEPGT